MSDQSTVRPYAGLWQRVPLGVRAIAVGLIVTEVGITGWAVVLVGVPPLLWPVVVPALLALYWLFFSGRLFGRASRPLRRECFRETSLAPATWKWGLAAAALFVVAMEASIFTLFRLVPFPDEQFVRPAVVRGMPAAALWAGLIAASLVAGLCEETGFRGYVQRPLEGRYGPGVAIAISTAAFAALHLNQPWAITLMPPILLAGVLLGVLAYSSGSLIPGIIGHAVMDVFNFSYWWWSLIGHYDRRTVFETGVDGDFVLWAGTLAGSLLLFWFVAGQLRAARPDSYTSVGGPDRQSDPSKWVRKRFWARVSQILAKTRMTLSKTFCGVT
jgi:membrane protease YdiL (CAAX protease family)